METQRPGSSRRRLRFSAVARLDAGIAWNNEQEFAWICAGFGQMTFLLFLTFIVEVQTIGGADDWRAYSKGQGGDHLRGRTLKRFRKI